MVDVGCSGVQSGLESTLKRMRSVPKDEITLTVPRGIGDIFWIYQLHSPRSEKINFRVSVANTKNLKQQRADPFLHLLPKVGEVTPLVQTPVEYKKLYTGHWPVGGGVNGEFSCNRWLEQGHRLEGHGEVEWRVKMPEAPIDLPPRYLLVYCSRLNGVKGTQLWTADQWARAVLGLLETLDASLPVVLFGSNWDVEALEAIRSALPASLSPRMIIHPTPEQVIYILRRATFFLAYQSGLSILADNEDCPQLMLYFNRLAPMLYSWCQPDNKRTRYFADVFGSEPESSVESVTWRL